ncbi:MAG: hypothetical protein WD490_08710 [Opitutales bacterium]
MKQSTGIELDPKTPTSLPPSAEHAGVWEIRGTHFRFTQVTFNGTMRNACDL